MYDTEEATSQPGTDARYESTSSLQAKDPFYGFTVRQAMISVMLYA